MNIVYHYTDFSRCKTDFRGTWSECMDWIAASGDPKAYYMRVVR